MAAHQAPPSLGFSRQEHWSGLPFPSSMHESEKWKEKKKEKWKWSHSVASKSLRPHGCFYVLVIANSAAMNFGVHVSFWITIFSGYMQRTDIARLYGSSIFSFLRNLHTSHHSGCASLHSHQQCYEDSHSPHRFHHLLFVDFFGLCVDFFDDGHSDWCKVIPHCSFDLHLSNN